MSTEGVIKLETYFSAEDQKVFEPLFIAQYLFAPVNTIVKNSLLPWMMEQIGILIVNDLANKDQAKKIKAEVFLKYSVLVELMTIAKKYGRNDDYYFDTDKKLNCNKTGNYTDQENTDRTRIILAIN